MAQSLTLKQLHVARSLGLGPLPSVVLSLGPVVLGPFTPPVREKYERLVTGSEGSLLPLASPLRSQSHPRYDRSSRTVVQPTTRIPSD